VVFARDNGGERGGVPHKRRTDIDLCPAAGLERHLRHRQDLLRETLLECGARAGLEGVGAKLDETFSLR
jgi:hypothetical protein